MVDPQASRFWLSALQSGLMDVPSLTACWEAIPPEKREAPEHLDRRLARQAVQQSHLTLWQAQQLLAGRTSGFRVDRYLLVDLIGHGGMGRVYLARDTRLGRLVALKILAPERMNNPRAIARFQREARVGAQLQHENLVRIYDFGESNGRFFLVMEYIEGKTIGALITSQGPMPAPTAARLARQIALGLEHAHRKGLIHRDVNPYNVLVTHDGIAKLADLGLAIDLAEEERVTREGATVGTFDYVAPEQARHSHAADIRSDIYSLGCTLYHMVAGQVPFPSPSLPEKLFAHQALEPTPLSQLAEDVPPALVEVVQRMMRKVPEERYATPLQVAQALEPFIEDYPRIRQGETEPSAQGLDETSRPGSYTPPQSGEAQVVAASQGALEGLGARFTSGPGPSRLVSGEGQPMVVNPFILTPVSDNETNSPESIPLILDLGPDSAIADSPAQPRAWLGMENPIKMSAASNLAPWAAKRLSAVFQGTGPSQHRSWLWVLATIVIVLALLVVGYELVHWLGKGQGAIHRPRAALPKAASQKSGPPPPIAVLTSDGQETPVQDFYQAMETAVGAQGSVVLRNQEPLRISTGDRAFSFLASGWLKITAGKGASPVLLVELKGQQPFLTTGSGMNLILDGLTIRVRYKDQAPGAGSNPAPIIQAAGPVQLKYCAFEVEHGADQHGSRALVSDGGTLTVENCWFNGFETALDVHSIGDSTTTVRQTMLIAPRKETAGSSPPAASEDTGWGLRMENLAGGRAGAPRRLTLDHCTVTGAGFLRLVGFSQGSPVQIKARNCAARIESLLAWEPAAPDQPLNPQALRWSGDGNHLDVVGRSWIVIPVQAASGTPPPSPIWRPGCNWRRKTIRFGALWSS